MLMAKNDKLLDSTFIIGPDNGLPELSKSYPEVLRKLVELGITDASSQPNICKRCGRWYYLKTNWSTDYPIYLIYNYLDYDFDPHNEFILDTSENTKGFHKTDKNHNETWGLGEKWKMFRLVKEITDVKT
jgi:hypothetical protein